MDKSHLNPREQEIEKFRFELAEELGLIEQVGKGRRTRATVLKQRKTPHVNKAQKKGP